MSCFTFSLKSLFFFLCFLSPSPLLFLFPPPLPLPSPCHFLTFSDSFSFSSFSPFSFLSSSLSPLFSSLSPSFPPSLPPSFPPSLSPSSQVKGTVNDSHGVPQYVMRGYWDEKMMCKDSGRKGEGCCHRNTKRAMESKTSTVSWEEGVHRE